jgi:hypothetical protein
MESELGGSRVGGCSELRRAGPRLDAVEQVTGERAWFHGCGSDRPVSVDLEVEGHGASRVRLALQSALVAVAKWAPHACDDSRCVLDAGRNFDVGDRDHDVSGDSKRGQAIAQPWI